MLKKTHTRRRKLQISVSNSSNIIHETIFLHNTNPPQLVSAFINALDRLATQSRFQIQLKLFEVGTAIKIKLCNLLEQLNQRHNRAETVIDFVDDCIVDSEDQDLPAQFLQIQKNQLNDLQEHFERYCNVLPVFGFNSANYVFNLIKSYLLPTLVNERDIEPTAIKYANQFASHNFGDIQLLDLMKFSGGTTSLDSFPEA